MHTSLLSPHTRYTPRPSHSFQFITRTILIYFLKYNITFEGYLFLYYKYLTIDALVAGRNACRFLFYVYYCCLNLMWNMWINITDFLISNFRRVLYVVCFLLGNSPASEFYMLTFRNTLSVLSL
jgi:hypothetical protein